MSALETRYLGHCQICEGEQKLAGGRVQPDPPGSTRALLVHHGYRRPGDGAIHGDCPGVAHEPYEHSCEQCKVYLAERQQLLAVKHNYLANLKAGNVTRFVDRSLVRHGLGSWVEFVAGVTAPWLWEQYVKNRIAAVEWSIVEVEREVTRMEKRIAAWKLAPIRTIEEEKAEKRAAKAVRDAEKAEKRAAKRAKEDATKAKLEALRQRRETISKEFRDAFLKAAAEKDLAEGRRLAAKLCLGKHSWLSARDLEIPEAFIALGLATREKTERGEWVRYLVY